MYIRVRVALRLAREAWILVRDTVLPRLERLAEQFADWQDRETATSRGYSLRSREEKRNARAASVHRVRLDPRNDLVRAKWLRSTCIDMRSR